MNEPRTGSPIANIKWLLVALAVVLGALIAYGVPDLLGEKQEESPYDISRVDVSSFQEQADRAVERLQENPGDTDALADAGKAYLDMAGRYNDADKSSDKNDLYRSAKAAVDYHRRYLDLKPDDYQMRIGLGLSYGYLDMSEIAERELAVATAAEPSSQRAWLTLGFIRMKAGKYEEAGASLQKAVDIDPASEAGREAQSQIDDIQKSLSHPSVTAP